MNTYSPHPSIRIKGTETNYNPTQCIDPDCSMGIVHMHCPFCTKRDSFQDPILLKAHYRVKHVDKSLEFAGLKVLRCCDSCDIVGAIKGEKKFRGAHWHCYRCRNGFNRRDEALKHYKTHFRNPHTTFQIQVAQELNQQKSNQLENEAAAERLITLDDSTIHPALTEAVMSAESITALNVLTSHNGNNRILEAHVAANETVGTSDGQTIMIIQDEGEGTFDGTASIICQSSNEPQDKQINQMRKQIQSLLQSNSQLTHEKGQMEKKHKQEIEQLTQQVSILQKDLESYQSRESKLIQELSVSIDSRITELLTSLQTQHTDLLHQHLIQLKREYLGTQLTKSKDVAWSAGEVDGDTSTTTYIISEDMATLDNRVTVMTTENSNSDGSISITMTSDTPPSPKRQKKA